jgi:hypothetical protein
MGKCMAIEIAVSNYSCNVIRSESGCLIQTAHMSEEGELLPDYSETHGSGYSTPSPQLAEDRPYTHRPGSRDALPSDAASQPKSRRHPTLSPRWSERVEFRVPFLAAFRPLFRLGGRWPASISFDHAYSPTRVTHQARFDPHSPY